MHCIYKQDIDNAKKVFNAVNARWPIPQGNIRKHYYYLLYQFEDHEEIIKEFNSCKDGHSFDEEASLYIATLYKIGKILKHDPDLMFFFLLLGNHSAICRSRFLCQKNSGFQS